jgi:excisionase family DNA binding protein
MTNETLWRIDEVARYLGIPASSVYKMTCPKAKLRIPHIRICGRLRFRKDLIDAWLSALTYSSTDLLLRMNAEAKKVSYGNRH